MAAIVDADIIRAVSRGAFAAGKSLDYAGKVDGLRASEDGTVLEANVVGSGRSVYSVVVGIRRVRHGRAEITGGCNCSAGFNCKHVAAVVFAYNRQPSRPELALEPHSAASIAPEPLPPEVAAWLKRLDSAQEPETEDYPPSVRKRLLYVLDEGRPGASTAPDSVAIALYSVTLRPDGRPTSPAQPWQMSQTGQEPKFLRPSDRAILRRVRLGIEPSDLAAVVGMIVATGRGRWSAWDGPVLTPGDPAPGALAWELAEDARQRPVLRLADGRRPLGLETLMYVDPQTGVVGPIEAELPDRLLRAMLSSPALLPETAARVRGQLGQRWPERALPAPEALDPPELVSAAMQPRLRLVQATLPTGLARYVNGRFEPPVAGPTPVPLARLSFQYGPVAIGLGEYRDLLVQQGRLVQVVRNATSEARAGERMRGLGFARVSHRHNLPSGHPNASDLLLADMDPGAWIDFMLHDLPELRAEGWLVDIAEDFPLRLAAASGDVLIEVRESSGIDWFDLDLGIMVDGARVDLGPALLDLLGNPGFALDAAGGDTDLPVLLPLPDGRLLAIPLGQLQPILAPLLELFADAQVEPGTGVIRLSRRNAGDLALLEAATAGGGVAWSGGDALRALGRQLREHGGIPPCATPAGFGATLRPYQAHGLAWLQFLRAAELGGVLADDMGLGKTVQLLAHLAVEHAAGRLDRPALVVCPTSLAPNWRAEAQRFAPMLRTLVLHGPNRADQFGAIPGHDLLVTTYPLLARDHAVLAEQEWHVVVLDEAQVIKNPLATTSKLARTLRARQRLCLSGTPLENHLGELWSLFDFLMPGFLGDRQGFGRRFRAPIEKGGDLERQALLSLRIAPFLLRRTKAEVAPELPPKTEITETVEMGEAQRALYEGIRIAMHAKVRAAIAKRGLAGSGIVILDALLKLRQACCDPRLLKLTAAKGAKAGSAKLDRLFELLPQMLEEGRRVLLFSQFTSMLALIEAELGRLGLPYVLLTGDTTDRTVPVRQFQGGEIPLFLISLKAGGVGLNLTAADTVIHYDPWWNPAVEDQATDRAHRIGQNKPVFVHRLVTQGSIEEKMEGLKARKQALAAGVLGAAGGRALALSEGDLDALFAPLSG